MSLENGADVNTESTSSVDSSAAEVVQNTETESNGALSGETVTEPTNSGKKPDPVSYDRFKEVNERMKKAEQRSKELEEKYNTYKDLDSVITTNPKFAAKINKVIEDFNSGKIDAEEANEKIETIEEGQVQQYKKSTSSIDYDKSLKAIHQEFYINSFEKMAHNDYQDAEDIKAIQGATEMVLDKLRPGWINRYDSALLKKAYEEAKGFLEGFSNRRLGKYTSEKAKDIVPTSKPGIPAITEKKVVSSEDAINVLAEGLKAFKSD